MSWSLVGAVINPIYGSATNASKAVTAGNLLVYVDMNSLAAQSTSISDGVNAWTKIIDIADTVNNNHLSVFVAKAATTATITIVPTETGGAVTEFRQLLEYSTTQSIVAGSFVRTSNSYTGGGTTGTTTDGVNVGALASTVSGDLILAQIYDSDVLGSFGDAQKFNAGTGYTDRPTASNGSSDPPPSGASSNAIVGHTEDQTSAGGTVTPTVTALAAGFHYFGWGIAFYETATGTTYPVSVGGNVTPTGALATAYIAFVTPAIPAVGPGQTQAYVHPGQEFQLALKVGPFA